MDDHHTEQLDKILALADSNHEGEAVVAVRKAREMLLRDGLSFGDLARIASSRSHSKGGVFAFMSGQREYMETQLYHLRQQLDDMQAQMQTQDLQLDFWRRRAIDLEQKMQHVQSEAEKWRKLAGDTTNRLWDLGRSLGLDEFAEKESMPEPVKKVAGKK